MKRIKKIGVLQTAKVVAAIYFFLIILAVIPMWLFMSTFGGEELSGFPFFGGVFLLVLPFLYAIVIFVMTALFCLIYNGIAGRIGGIELELEVIDEIRE
ncbi:MAG: hypothetical protein R3275_03275 [Saprospiraceae bacterium]|nr:hypothetical protein [Saprospiraceae bacterium]